LKEIALIDLSFALHKKSIINPCLACEAGGSVEPGASAPGKNGLESSARDSGRKREILRLSPVSRAQSVALRCPGADAPGFMLSPASQAKTFVISTFCKAVELFEEFGLTLNSPGFCSTGAAEDGRAPTEELSCVRDCDFCSTGAAEDGRAPTEELSCVSGWDFCSTRRPLL
jgi:hypothetical protein